MSIVFPPAMVPLELLMEYNHFGQSDCTLKKIKCKSDFLCDLSDSDPFSPLSQT